MAIAFDAKSQLTATSSTVDGSWTHTPVGTPAGVVVMVAQGGSTTDQVVSVTYGGVAMTRIGTQSSDNGEPERSYLYFLGTPGSGAKTVAVDISGSTAYSATAVTVTADSGLTAIDVSNSGNGITSNPTLSLDYTDGLADWIAIVVMTEGANAVTGFSINTGTSLYENDHGTQVGGYSYLEGTGGNSTSFNTTAGNASWSWVGVVLTEVSLAVTTPFQVISPFSFSPTEGAVNSTWDFFTDREPPQADATNVPAELVTVTVTGFDGDVTIAPNAGTITAAVVVTDGDITIAPNAGTTSASVTANNPGPSVAANAGHASVSVTANTPDVTLQPNAETVVVAVTSNDASKTVAPNAGTTTATVTANNSVTNVQANAGLATVSVTATDVLSEVQENQAWPKNGPAPVFGPLNSEAASTWTFFAGGDTTVTVADTDAFAESTTVSVTAENAGPSVQPNAGTASVTATAGASTAAVASNADTTTAVVTSFNAGPVVSANAGLASVSVAANNTAPTVAPNAEQTVVTVSAFDVSASVQENQAWPKNGPAPIFSPLNTEAASTWTLFAGGDTTVVVGATNAPAEATSATVTAENAGPSVAANAGLALVSVAANNSASNVQPNAGTATAAVSAENAASTVAANAGLASVTVLANNAVGTVQPNAGTTTGAVTTNDAGPAVAANADFAQVTVEALNVTAGVPEDLHVPIKNGPSPIFSPLNPQAPSTWTMFSLTGETPSTFAQAGVANVSVSATNPVANVQPDADTTTATVAANNANPGVQPSPSSTSASVTANQPGPSVRANAGVATVSVTSLQVTINQQPNAGTASVIAVANNGSISVRVNAGVANVAVTALQPTTPIAGVANAGFASVAVAAFNAVAQGVNGAVHDYSGIGDVTITGEPSNNAVSGLSGSGGATDISNTSNTISRVEGG